MLEAQKVSTLWQIGACRKRSSSCTKRGHNHYKKWTLLDITGCPKLCFCDLVQDCRQLTSGSSYNPPFFEDFNILKYAAEVLLESLYWIWGWTLWLPWDGFNILPDFFLAPILLKKDLCSRCISRATAVLGVPVHCRLYSQLQRKTAFSALLKFKQEYSRKNIRNKSIL